MVGQRGIEVPTLWRKEWNHLLKVSHFLRVKRMAIRIQDRYIDGLRRRHLLASFEDTNFLSWLMCTER